MINNNSFSVKPEHLGFLLIAACSVWLIFSASLVVIDNDDGFANVLNSHYFIGEQGLYAFQRGPLMGILLTPAAIIAKSLNLDPIDARPYHAITSIMLIVYLVGCWKILSLVRENFVPFTSYASLIAFSATIPGFLFFSYAPFLNTDLFPGLLLVAMLYLTHSYIQQPTRQRWLLLMFLGLTAVLFKTTFAIFWIVIICAQLILIALNQLRNGVDLHQWKLFGKLFLAASTSAVLAWLIYSLALESVRYELKSPNPLLNPLFMYFRLMTRFEESYVATQFPFWLYLRNFPVLGFLTTLLTIPSLIYSAFSRNIFLQRAVLVWILCFTIMHLISFKEVRYIAYLTPLLSVLLAFTITKIGSKFNRSQYLLLAPLILDLTRAGTEASRITHTFYQKSQADFFQLPKYSADHKNILINRSLSFVSPVPSPLYADRYHRIFNMVFIDRLYYDSDLIFRITDVNYSYKLSLNDLSPNMLAYITYGVLHRRTPWSEDNLPTGLESFFQFAATTERLTLVREGDRFFFPKDEQNGYPLLLLKAGHISEPVIPKISFDYFSKDDLVSLFGTIPENIQEINTLGLRVHYLCDGMICGDTGRPE